MQNKKIEVNSLVEIFRDNRWYSAKITSIYDGGYISVFNFIMENGEESFDSLKHLFSPIENNKCPACSGEKEIYYWELGKMECHFCKGSGIRLTDVYDFSI